MELNEKLEGLNQSWSRVQLVITTKTHIREVSRESHDVADQGALCVLQGHSDQVLLGLFPVLLLPKFFDDPANYETKLLRLKER